MSMHHLAKVLVISLLLLSLGVCKAEEENPAFEFYYKQLPPNYQAVYRAIVDMPLEKEIRTVVLPEAMGSAEEGILNDLCAQTYEAVVHDHQDLKAANMCLGVVEYDAQTNSLTIEVTVSSFCVNEMKQADKLINHIVAGADPTWDRYTKYLYISNVITGTMEYNIDVYNDLGQTEKVAAYNNTYLGVNEGLSVCGGYASLFKVLADRIGLPCVETSGFHGEEAHAWNAVLMEDGNWYMVEPQGQDGLHGSLTMEQNQYYLDEWGYIFDYPQIEVEDDYLYEGNAVHPGTVDLTELRKQNDATETIFLYDVTSDGCVITDFRGLETGNLVIPEQIDGHVVRGIGESAFAYSDFDGMLFLPQTVEYIGNQAFYKCHFVGELILPSSLKWIGPEAFNGCEGINGYVYLPEGLTNVGEYAFKRMSGVQGFYLPASLIQWNNQIVAGCTKLRTYILAEDHPAFNVVDGVLYSKDMTRLIGCPAQYSGALTVPEGVLTIGKFALNEIAGITHLYLPSTLECVEQEGCSFLSGLEEPLEIPKSLRKAGNGAFQKVWLQQTLTLPALEEIGRHVFAFCWGVETLIVSEGIKDLGPTTFYWCFSLQEIFLPSTLEHVAENCIQLDLPRLKIYGYEGTEAEALVERAKRAGVTFHPLTNGMGLSENWIELSPADPAGVMSVQLMVRPSAGGMITWISTDDTVAKVDENGLVTAVREGYAEIIAQIGDVKLSCPVGVYSQVLYSADGKTLLRVADNFAGQLVIREGTETIASHAIEGISGITGIQFPESLKRIEKEAISLIDCRVAFELNLPATLEYIGASGLGCGKFKTLCYPLNAEIGASAFGAIRTETVIIPEGVERLPRGVFATGQFHSGDYIGACYLPASLTYAPIDAFYYMPVGVFYGYRGTFAERYVAELQKRYPDMEYTFVALPRYISPSTVVLEIGETYQLDWYSDALWISSNADIASVCATGKVTAVTNGAATITAMLSDGTSTCCYVMIGDVALPGDVNNDAIVDVQDIQRYMAWYCDKDAVINSLNADINSDGAMDMRDIIVLQEWLGDSIAAALPQQEGVVQ